MNEWLTTGADLLIQAVASFPDTLVTKQIPAEASWFQEVTTWASGLASIALLILAVALVPAAWQQGGRLPVGTGMTLPMFRGRIGADLLYAGFTGISLEAAIGTPTPAGPAGAFFLLSENPGEPRFGLDPPGSTAPPTRSSLAWSHLALPAGAVHATSAALPAVPDANFPPATTTAAAIANLVRQRPFRAFLHASLLVRLPG